LASFCRGSLLSSRQAGRHSALRKIDGFLRVRSPLRTYTQIYDHPSYSFLYKGFARPVERYADFSLFALPSREMVNLKISSISIFLSCPSSLLSFSERLFPSPDGIIERFPILLFAYSLSEMALVFSSGATVPPHHRDTRDFLPLPNALSKATSGRPPYARLRLSLTKSPFGCIRSEKWLGAYDDFLPEYSAVLLVIAL